MEYIDLHAHMVSRTTDDYRSMAMSGCVAVTEPAFWAGYDHPTADIFADYFDRLTDFEPKRAAQYGIAHFTWMCLNPKEGEDRALAREVLAPHPALPREAERARHRRDRAQPGHPQRARDLRRPRGPRRRARPAHPHPHAAPRGQVEGHQGDRRDARGGPPPDPAPRDGRPRRGAHDRDDPRQRLLDGAHALSHHQGLAGTRGRHARDLRPGAHLRGVRLRLGREPPARESRSSSWRCAGAAIPTPCIRRVVYENPLEFLGQCEKFQVPERERAVAI